MTAFSPPDWGRKAKVTIDHTKVFAGPHSDYVLLLTHDNFITACDEAITLGDTYQMQANGGDLRASSDASGLTQIPLWVMSVSLNANPALSKVFAFVRVPSINNATDVEIWLHWLPAAAATPETTAGSYGRNATFSRYYFWFAMQEDPTTSAQWPDLCGTHSDHAPGITSTVGAGGPIGNQMTYGDYNSDAQAGVSLTSQYAVGIFCCPTTTENARVELPNSLLWRFNGNTVKASIYISTEQKIEFNPAASGTVINAQWSQNGNDAFLLGNGVLQGTRATTATPLTTTSLITECTVGTFLSHYRAVLGVQSADALKTEDAMLRISSTFSAIAASVPSAATAVITLLNCPSGYRLAAHFAPGLAEPHGAEFDSVASATAGTNTLSGTVTGSADLFLSVVGGGHRPFQAYYVLPSTGLTIDMGALLQTDLVYKSALAASVTEGVDYDLTPGSKEIDLTNAISGRALYSSAVDDFKTSGTLTANWFPIYAVERAWLRLKRGWVFATSGALKLASSGFDRVIGEESGAVQEEHVGQSSLGTLTGTTVYYSLAGGAATALGASGSFNEPIKTYQIAGTNNRNATLVFFARRHGYDFKLSSIAAVGGTLEEPANYAHALDTSTVDPNIVDPVATVDATAPYTGMSVTVLAANTAAPSLTAWANATAYAVNDVVQSAAGRWFRCTVGGTSSGTDANLAGGSDSGVTWVVFAGERLVSGAWYAFGTIIDGNSGTPAQVHTYAQRRLLFDGPDRLKQTQFGAYSDGIYSTTVGVFVDDVIGQVRHTDLTGVLRTPLVLQTFSVAGLVVGDIVLVAPNDGSGGVDYNQLTANGAQSSGAGTFVVNEAIPADTPTTGSLRIFIGTVRQRVAYSSWSGSTFTLSGTLPGNVLDDAEAYISYVDKVATSTTEYFSASFIAERSLMVFVRDGGVTPIKPFQTPATFTSTGGGVTAIRTPDE